MSSRPDLRLDWVGTDAAIYACKRWHYSRRVPVFKCVRLGVFEYGKFIGVVLFGQGATPQLGSPYGLIGTQVCELTRIALTEHRTQVSRIVKIALRFLLLRCPGLRLVISFADAGHGHHGGIYQGGGWIYLGGRDTHSYRVNGVVTHPKTLHSRYGKGGQSVPWLRSNIDPYAERIEVGFKHRYAMPLDAEMRARILPLAKPYPKRAKEQDGEHHSSLGGVTPTRTLQIAESENA